MNNDYTEAPATKMLATNCVCCGRALVDAVSVEVGMGPECRDEIFPEGIEESDRKIANEHVFHAAVAAQRGGVEKVLEYAELIRKLGFVKLADKVARRFVKGAERADRNPEITICEENGKLLVSTPYRRGKAEEFIKAWRAVPGRWFDRSRSVNVVPSSSKEQLWELLKTYFPGKWGKGPKGVFRIPVA
jgi:hypothetical protein